MDPGTIAFIAVVVCAGALVQGLSGLGFPLVVAPVVTQIVPGTGAVGLVNALSIVQNLWLIARTRGAVAWPVLFRMAPGLALGIMLGWVILQVLNEEYFPVIVAVSATASVLWLLFAKRFKGFISDSVSAAWGGAVNTIAGVGGPPIASFLVMRGLTFSSYVRTLQVTFAVIDVISLPILGVYAPSFTAIAVWVFVLFLGSLAGELFRQRLSEHQAETIGKSVIIVVCVIALVRSLITISQ
jgi:uncharacterized membrane protein YfcA